MAEPFIGEIRMFPYNFAPKDWAYCDGQEVDIYQNMSLYAILGLNYGGDGASTFALPDLKGRVPMHHGRGPGLYSKWIGEMGGYETSTLLPSQMPATGRSDKTDAEEGRVARTDAYPHENRQPYLVLSFCVALDGVFPARS